MHFMYLFTNLPRTIEIYFLTLIKKSESKLSVGLVSPCASLLALQMAFFSLCLQDGLPSPNPYAFLGFIVCISFLGLLEKITKIQWPTTTEIQSHSSRGQRLEIKALETPSKVSFLASSSSWWLLVFFTCGSIT